MAKGSGGKRGKRRSGAGSGDEPLALVYGAVPKPPVWQRALGRLTGARACYGKPIEAHGHVVIPVATLRTLGGLGYGNGIPADDPTASPAGSAGGPAGGGGGGGGGLIDARPVGFIDIGPDGVRFQAIDVPAAAPARQHDRPDRARHRRRVTCGGGPGGPLGAGQAAAGSGPPWPRRSMRR